MREVVRSSDEDTKEHDQEQQKKRRVESSTKQSQSKSTHCHYPTSGSSFSAKMDKKFECKGLPNTPKYNQVSYFGRSTRN